MNEEEMAALEEALVQIAQHEAALADMMGIICHHLSVLNPAAASAIASSLEAISAKPGIETTPAFQNVLSWVIHNLQGRSEMQLRSFYESRPNQTSRQQLRHLLRVVPGGKTK